MTKLSLLLGAVCLAGVRCDSRSCGKGEARLDGRRVKDDGVLLLLLLLLLVLMLRLSYVKATITLKVVVVVVEEKKIS